MKKIILTALASLIATTSFAENIQVTDKQDIIALLPRCETLEVKYVRFPENSFYHDSALSKKLNDLKIADGLNRAYTKEEIEYQNLGIEARKAKLNELLVNTKRDLTAITLNKNNLSCLVSVNQEKTDALFQIYKSLYAVNLNKTLVDENGKKLQ
ncbi:hypothetical protein [Burkholderia sp. LMG 13014]|uniref:hypothetical protein n=1 Tax=Burkholderia sp. LMG 13014 TaxID=2709306 RepID=UPI00196356F7|nr:hypothetical protein [Burkholderia sp. LMG 13014]